MTSTIPNERLSTRRSPRLGRAPRPARRGIDQGTSFPEVKARVRIQPEADEQAHAIEDWWRANRPASPNLFDEELAAAFALLASAPTAVRRYLARSIPGLRRDAPRHSIPCLLRPRPRARRGEDPGHLECGAWKRPVAAKAMIAQDSPVGAIPGTIEAVHQAAASASSSSVRREQPVGGPGDRAARRSRPRRSTARLR